jgi:Holliday junction resolvase
MREQAIQSKLIKSLESQGYYVIKLIKTNKNGIPDVVAIPPGCPVEFYEVKVPGKKPSVLQNYRIKELKDHGCKAEVFDGEKVNR